MKVITTVVLVLIAAAAMWFARQRLADRSASPTASPALAAVAESRPKAAATNPTMPPPPAPVVATSRVPSVATRAESPIPQPAYPAVSLAEMLRPNNEVYDPVLGMSVTYPEGWSVRDVALRWGANNGENTLFFAPPQGSQAVPSMYYRRYSDGPAFDRTNPEATLRDMARQKEESRSNGGQNDYRNDADSFVFREFNGNPSLSYFATYSRGSDLHAEYFMRILGPQGYVMFFVRGPANDVKAVIPSVYQMGGTVRPP